MVKRKLAVALFLVITALCGVIGFAACGEQHVHTFSEDWTRSTTEHWHEATCDHTDEKGDLGTHVDSDNNGKCDKCNYDMSTAGTHTHTFDDSYWEHDANTHWHPATCGDTTEKGDEAPHIDENENQFCDVCGEFIQHVHKFSETEWAFNKTEHWRPAVCTHKTEKGSEAEHTFTAGVCECGVKQEEVEAFNGLVEYGVISENETDFYSWLTDLKANDITDVHKTTKGDIVYSRDGNIEAYYVAERTVKVKAAADNGDGLEHVWFKVAMSENGTYHINDNNIDALAVAETGADGVAELTFKPIGGYSNGEKIKYEILLAEAKDIEVLIGTEEKDVKIIPDRYSIKLADDEEVESGKAVVTDFEVSDADTIGDDISGTLEFKYDTSWRASEKQMLPYVRYYANPAVEHDESDSPAESGQSYTFMATANNTFDYMLFSPAHGYDWSQGSDSDDYDTIQANYRKSASGVYNISFTVTGNVNACLYYWSGNLDLTSNQKSDGSPDDSCVVSVSGTKPQGSNIPESKFTNSNYVTVTISPDLGLDNFQLGIICDEVCMVTITVERVANYSNIVGEPIVVGRNENNGEGYAFEAYKTSRVPIGEVEPGLYEITINAQGNSTAGAVQVYTKSESERSFLWKGSHYQGFIRIEEGDEYVYVRNGSGGFTANSIELTEFTAPTVSSGTTYGVPISRASNNDNIVSKFSSALKAGQYQITITLRTTYFFNTSLTVKIGSEIYNPPITGLETYKFTIYADIAPNDTLEITGECRDLSRFYCNMELTLLEYPLIPEGEAVEFDFKTCEWTQMFFAEKEGTYRITITLLESRPDVLLGTTYGDAAWVSVYDKRNSRFILKNTKNYEKPGDGTIQQTASATFEASAGDTFILGFTDESFSNSKYSIIIEFVE